MSTRIEWSSEQPGLKAEYQRLAGHIARLSERMSRGGPAPVHVKQLRQLMAELGRVHDRWCVAVLQGK